MFSRSCFVYLLILAVSAMNTLSAQFTGELSLDEKIGQLFMIAAYSDKDDSRDAEYIKLIEKYKPGGVIFFQGTALRQRELLDKMQAASDIPLLVGIDAEHGVGWRLKDAMTFPQMQTLGAIRNDSLITEAAAAIARHCRIAGVNINFSPDADVNSNPENPIIGVRSFGEIPESVGRKAIAYMKGSLEEGVYPVAKHFPGHGDTHSDSHATLPVVHRSADSLQFIELMPFRMLVEAGCPAIMTGHLQFPAIDSSGISASLSRKVVTDLLTDSMMFYGIKVTDALNMKGARKNLSDGETEVMALQAGNDILLFPENPGTAFSAVKKAVEKGRISERELDLHVAKILHMKSVLFASGNSDSEIPAYDPDSLRRMLNSEADSALREELYAKALTLIRNRDGILPLKRLDTLKIAALYYGGPVIREMQEMFEKYADVTPFTSAGHTAVSIAGRLKNYNCVIVCNSAANNRRGDNYGFSVGLVQMLEKLTETKNVILCHPATPYGLEKYMNTGTQAVLIGYEKTPEANRAMAQAVFGGIGIDGILPVSISEKYPAGRSIITEKIRLGYSRPERAGVNSEMLRAADSICLAAIKDKAAPGCEVLVARNGFVIYDKAFGTDTYQSERKNTVSDLYDIASVTKITATLPAVMQLYDRKMFNLTDYAAPLCPVIANASDKAEITFAELLCHQSGLPSGISFFAKAVNPESVNGRLFSTRYDSRHTKKLKNNLYIDPGYKFRDSTLSNTPRQNYIKLEERLFVHPAYVDSCFKYIAECKVNPAKSYVYSDLNFILLGKVVENCTGMPLNKYCQDNIFAKIGAYRTGFAPDGISGTVPSSVDNTFGRGDIRGTVHDPAAALFGGVSGHAGLFSTANDLAKIMELYLQHGKYGGEQLIDSTTVNLFTSKNSFFANNRRGLGFDKQDPDNPKNCPAAPEASVSGFGHTGFTGTMVWSDPRFGLTYIFLSNRTYPDEYNNKLSENDIRTKIQSVIYQSIENR